MSKLALNERSLLVKPREFPYPLPQGDLFLNERAEVGEYSLLPFRPLTRAGIDRA
ncbi:hypothetical protein GCM10010924_60540 [Rhizobium wenxiniae]|nr:hypothetical protein GCM10010924_60540 [Rhizobium wenxiniae]